MSYPGYPYSQGASGDPSNQQYPYNPHHATTELSYPSMPGPPLPQNANYNPYPSNPGDMYSQAPYPSSQTSMPQPAAFGHPYPPSNLPYPTTPLSVSSYPTQNYPAYPGSNPPYPGSNPSYPGGYDGSNPSYPDSTPYPGSNNLYPGNNSYPVNNPPYSGMNPTYPGNPLYSGGSPSSDNVYPQISSHLPNPSVPAGGPSYPSLELSSNTSHFKSNQHDGSINSGGGYNMNHSVQNIKGNPTLVPFAPFNPREDAEVLRKAMKGFGTDEKAIINVLCKRTSAQRQEIALQFKTLYGKDLIKDLKSELGGKLESVIITMMTPVPEIYAKDVHDAVSGIGTNESTLIEVLCTLNNREIYMVKSAYQHLYHKSMESDLTSDTSGTFKRLMVSLCTANRSEDYTVNPGAAAQDAQALLRAGELKFGTDESTFNAVLCTRSYPQLKQVFVEYERLTGHGFDKAIKNEFSGDIEDGLLAIVKCVLNKAEFFAEALHNSMAGMGTKDRQLIRIVTTRSEVDMADIKTAFSAKYGKTLESFIEGDTSGDYKKALLALIA